MDYKGLKQGAGQDKLRKRDKTNGLEGAKNRGMAGWANQRKKEKMNGFIGAKNRGQGGPT